MRKVCAKCAYILIFQFVFVAAAFTNTLMVDEAENVLAETDRYRVRFKDGVLIHFHNKLTQETYTLPPQVDSNKQSGISIQHEEGQYGRREFIDDSWEVESKRLAPLTVEIAYHFDHKYKINKMVRLRISIDPRTQDLVIHQTSTSVFGGIVGVMWGCGYLDNQQVDMILPAHGGEVIDVATDTNERGKLQ